MIASTTAGMVSSIGPTNDTIAVRQPCAAPPDVAANGLPPVRGAVPGSTAPTPTARPRLAKNDTTTTVSHDTGFEMTPSTTLTTKVSTTTGPNTTVEAIARPSRSSHPRTPTATCSHQAGPSKARSFIRVSPANTARVTRPTPASPGVPVNTACTTKKTGSTKVRRAMPTSRLSRYQARTRRAAIEAVGDVPSSTGSRRPRPIRCPPELVSGEVSVRASSRTQTAYSRATNETARTRCTTNDAHLPVATSKGSDHAHPKGVHDATRADWVASKLFRSAPRDPVVSSVFIMSGMSVTTATTAAPSTR